jgi:hypothetical protein
VNYVGVDPGLEGGLAILSDDGSGSIYRTPTIRLLNGKRIFDATTARGILNRLPKSLTVAAVETTYRAAKASENIGLWKGIFVGLGIPHVPVYPITWQKWCQIYPPGSKEPSIKRAAEKWPGWMEARHDGIADALNIADWLMNGGWRGKCG